VVDLDGAREGQPRNLHHVERIANAVRVPIEVGGGLRDSVAVEEAIDAGAERVVVGTAALTNPELVNALIEVHGPERVMVSIDARKDSVVYRGWLEEGEASPPDLAAAMVARGVRGFVYTPVEADGMLAGPRVEGLRDLARALRGESAELVYSGGVGSVDDLAEIARIDVAGLGGVIVGRALYEGRFSIAEGQAALAG
jgi:phosphoribosylformimino-5-aminoimidazole carboxamide ribotide isomerase